MKSVIEQLDKADLEMLLDAIQAYTVAPFSNAGVKRKVKIQNAVSSMFYQKVNGERT